MPSNVVRQERGHFPVLYFRCHTADNPKVLVNRSQEKLVTRSASASSRTTSVHQPFYWPRTMLTFSTAFSPRIVAFATPVRLARLPSSSTSRPSLCVVSPRMSAPQERPSKVVVAADLTKWTVCAAVSSVLLYRRDTAVVLYCVGAGLNSATGKLLKQVIRQPRPTDSKSDPGMPSSHATSLSFLSLAVLAHAMLHPPTAAVLRAVYLGGAALVVLLALLATSWRVKAGYHTVGQVVVGWVLGAVDTVLWIKAFVPWATPALDAVVKDDVMGLALIGTILAVSYQGSVFQSVRA